MTKQPRRGRNRAVQAWGGGDMDARDRLATAVYQELRRRAGYLRRERVGHTLQPTALVHEVFLLLVKQDRTAWQNRAQFFGVASQMMRRSSWTGHGPATWRNDRAGGRGLRSMRDGPGTSRGRCAGPGSRAERFGRLRRQEKSSRRAALFGGCRSKRPATCWASPSPRWSGSGRRPARGFMPVSPEPQHDA